MKNTVKITKVLSQNVCTLLSNLILFQTNLESSDVIWSRPYWNSYYVVASQFLGQEPYLKSDHIKKPLHRPAFKRLAFSSYTCQQSETYLESTVRDQLQHNLRSHLNCCCNHEVTSLQPAPSYLL